MADAISKHLSQYDMVIVHRKGVDLVNADARSRIPEDVSYCDCYHAGCRPEYLPCAVDGCLYCPRIHEQWARFEEVEDVMPLAVRQVTVQLPTESAEEYESRLLLAGDSSTPETVDEDSGSRLELAEDSDTGSFFTSKYTHEQLRREQLLDDDLSLLIQWSEQPYGPFPEGEERPPSMAELKLSSPAVKFLWNHRSLLELRDGVIYYKWIEEHGSRWLFLVPAQMRSEVLLLCHDSRMSGHPGISRTYDRLLQMVFWRGMREECAIYVKACPVCNRQKKSSRHPQGELGSFHTGAPMERIHIDILGMFTPSSSGNEYILVLVCQFTESIEAYPVSDTKTQTVARVVVDNFVSRFGCPAQIHTDQGSNFTSDLFQAICDVLEIAKTRTTPYRPCSNGQVERYNRTLLSIIRRYIEEGVYDWDKHLSIITGAIRTLPSRQTGFTPNMLMLGREVSHPVGLVFGDPDQRMEEEPDYAQRLRSRLIKVHAMAGQKIGVAQEIQKKYYDLGKRLHLYEAGDLVLMLNKSRPPGISVKLLPIFKGPFLVIEVLSKVLLVIRDRRGQRVVHHDLVKPCTDRFIPLWLQRMRSQYFQNQGNPLPSCDGDPDPGVHAAGQGLSSVSSLIETGWIQCDVCQKWRRTSRETAEEFGEGAFWECAMGSDPAFDDCSLPEEDSSDWVQALDGQGMIYTVTGSEGASAGAAQVTQRGRVINLPSRYQQ